MWVARVVDFLFFGVDALVDGVDCKDSSHNDSRIQFLSAGLGFLDELDDTILRFILNKLAFYPVELSCINFIGLY